MRLSWGKKVQRKLINFITLPAIFVCEKSALKIWIQIINLFRRDKKNQVKRHSLVFWAVMKLLPLLLYASFSRNLSQLVISGEWKD